MTVGIGSFHSGGPISSAPVLRPVISWGQPYGLQQSGVRGSLRSMPCAYFPDTPSHRSSIPAKLCKARGSSWSMVARQGTTIVSAFLGHLPLCPATRLAPRDHGCLHRLEASLIPLRQLKIQTRGKEIERDRRSLSLWPRSALLLFGSPNSFLYSPGLCGILAMDRHLGEP